MTVSLSAQPLPSYHLDGGEVSASGATIWFTGLPSAGKTTIATALADRLAASGRAVEVLDGDIVRPVLSAELGYSRADRDVNVARIGWVAQRLARHGVLVLACVVSPFSDARNGVRRSHAEAGVAFFEVHVATPLDVCAARDVKGLYARQRAGTMTGLTGVDDEYEAPVDPELRIDTTDRSIDDVVDQLLATVVPAHEGILL
jgi:adenylylsulfate kinase